MKKLAGAALAALVAGPAMATDLPVKAPPIVPVYDWTGFYIGINGGYSFGRSETDFDFPGFPVVSGKFNINGAVLGGQAGHNWQVNPNWVVGVEGDLQWARQTGTLEIADGPFCVTPITTNFPVSTCNTAQATLEQRLTWFGTLRGRVGVLAAPYLLLYATGGVAFGEFENNVTVANITQATTFIGGAPVPGPAIVAAAAGSTNNNRIGWTVGGGAEFILHGPWTAKMEFLFVDYGNFSNTYTLAGVPVLTTNTHMIDNILRFGLNYRFGGPVVAKY
jgi:outer membrane immunogenic protein